MPNVYLNRTGSGDGLSTGTPAAFLSSGSWSTLITAHDYATDGPLFCHVDVTDPTEFTYSATLNLAAINSNTNPPTPAAPLYIIPCDDSFVPLPFQHWGWQSPQPQWSQTLMGRIFGTGAAMAFNLPANAFHIRGFHVRISDGNALVNGGSYYGCLLEQARSNGSAYVALDGNTILCMHTILRCSGTQFDRIADLTHNSLLSNCRLEGNPDPGGSGNRRGLVMTGNGVHQHDRLTVVGTVGEALYYSSGNAGHNFNPRRATIICPGAGARLNGTASQGTHYWDGVALVGPGSGNGIDCQSNANLRFTNGLLRGWGTNVANPTAALALLGVDTTSTETNTDTFVNPSAGDYRIKSTSEFWGKGIGAGDEPAAGGGEPNYPDETDVRDGVLYGDDDALEGNLVLPGEADVRADTQYGANGTEFTGTLPASEPGGAVILEDGMNTQDIQVGSTAPIALVRLRNDDGTPATGLTFETAGLACAEQRDNGTLTDITLATLASAQAAYSARGFREVDATKAPGLYVFHPRTEGVASGAKVCRYYFTGTGLNPETLTLNLVVFPQMSGDKLVANTDGFSGAAAEAIGKLPGEGKTLVLNRAGKDPLTYGIGAVSESE